MSLERRLLFTIIMLFPSPHLSHLCKVLVPKGPFPGSLHFIPGSSVEPWVKGSPLEGDSGNRLGPGMDVEE